MSFPSFVLSLPKKQAAFHTFFLTNMIYSKAMGNASKDRAELNRLFDELYIQHMPMVMRRCRRLLRDEEQALEAMQETFIRLLKRYDAGKIQYPSSLLYRIATNICLNLIRDAKARPIMEDSEELAKIAAEGDVERQTLISVILNRIFSREPDSTHAMATMHFVDGLTQAEVAREFNMSTVGVKKRLLRFRKNLLKKQEGI
jgi:RNA polymerase sigma-70 factor (ECF subfamily)